MKGLDNKLLNRQLENLFIISNENKNKGKIFLEDNDLENKIFKCREKNEEIVFKTSDPFIEIRAFFKLRFGQIFIVPFRKNSIDYDYANAHDPICLKSFKKIDERDGIDRGTAFGYSTNLFFQNKAAQLRLPHVVIDILNQERGKGIASLLLSIRHAIDLPLAYDMTRDDNSAVGLYKNLGYELVGTLNGFKNSPIKISETDLEFLEKLNNEDVDLGHKKGYVLKLKDKELFNFQKDKYWELERKIAEIY